MMDQETRTAIRDQVKDAEDAITGLRPEDAMIHLVNIEYILNDCEEESEVKPTGALL